MKNVLVEIKIPGAGKCFSVEISSGMRIYELNGMLVSAFESLTDEDFNPSGAVLCDAKTGEILDINKTVAQSGLVNGSGLLLI